MNDLSFILDEIAPPSRGRKPLSITYKRDLTSEDIQSLSNLKDGDLNQDFQPVLKLRSEHQNLARLVAEGVRNEEIAQITGYSISYISSLKSSDPAFKNLVDYYKAQIHEGFVEVNASLHSRLVSISMLAAEELQERLIEKPQDFNNRELNETLSMVADRTGFGTRTTNLNVNVDLGARLEKARARIGSVLPSDPRLEVNTPPQIDLQPLPEKA